MTLLIDALPLLVLIGLLASGRAGPVVSCVGAQLASLPAIWSALTGSGAESLMAFLAIRSLEGVWLALPAIGVITGGLVFHAAADHPRQSSLQRTGDAASTLFTTGFLLGPFTELVTGFGVGSVFAAGALRPLGLAGAPLAALLILAGSLIPWGGLGPGSALGAALAGVSPSALSRGTAPQSAVWLLLLLPLFWRFAAAAGHPVPAARRPAQCAWVAATSVLLIASNRVFPWEVAGIAATGPLLAARLLWANPPDGREDWRRAAAAAFPYVLLTASLLAARIFSGVPVWRPFAALPGVALNHPMIILWLTGLALLASRPDPVRSAGAALNRARKPAVAIVLYVVLARWLIGAHVPDTLARALADALGDLAPLASPVVAAASGFVAGSNVGANSATMPLQAALGRLRGFDPALLPSVQNFCGAACILLSPQFTAVAAGLAGEGATPRRIWGLTWPIAPIAIFIGLLTVAIG